MSVYSETLVLPVNVLDLIPQFIEIMSWTESMFIYIIKYWLIQWIHILVTGENPLERVQRNYLK